MKRFSELVDEAAGRIREIFPWDLQEMMEKHPAPLLVDVSEPYEYDAVHIAGSLNVPRGVLESACEYGYEETVPELAGARQREVVLVCRSGRRSALAALTLGILGFEQVRSLKTGLRGWNDFELPLEDGAGNAVHIDDADEYFTPRLRPEQRAGADR